ncbi:MAG: hypothetical protein PVH19_14715 [Planctomycetia bacterium]|jgi:hypothetical protein
MKPDVEKLFVEARPMGPSPELRTKVLDAVEAELSADTSSTKRRDSLSRVARWERRLGWVSVLGLLLAIGLNFLVYSGGPTSRRSLPPVSSSEVCQQYQQYQQILLQAAIFEKGNGHVYIQKNSPSPETSGDRPRDSRGDTSYYQRRGRLDHRFTG